MPANHHQTNSIFLVQLKQKKQKISFELQQHLVGIAGRFLGNTFAPPFIRRLRPLSLKASRVEPEWRRSLETGSQPPDRTPLGTAAAIVSEWVTDRLR